MARPRRLFAPTVATQLPLPDVPFTTSRGTQRASSASMQQVIALAARVAPFDSTVLITGESGVGKERLARMVHEASRRAQGPFIAVNCGAFADALLESELFGHARGAFTGAVTDRPGVFEAAHGGTLFLDEIGEVSPAMQVRLLRVLQEREVRRVGEIRVRRVDVRLIAATHRDLWREVEEGTFRHDLYYRLRVVDLHVPPLRERPDDLQTLTAEFLERTVARLERPIHGYTADALDRLFSYLWPGNIRELEHAIERACAVATGPLIDVEDLPEAVRGEIHSGGPDDTSLAARELAYIRAVVGRHHGNKRAAAQELQISVSTLNRRLQAKAPHRQRAATDAKLRRRF